MYSKKNRSGKSLQSGRKAGMGTGGLRNPKRSQDLRAALAQKKTQAGRAQLTSKSKARSLVDARQKIATKKGQSKPLVRSISLINERRKEQRQNLQQQNRSLSLSTGGNIQVTARQDVPPDRMATMMGNSIQITAKVERSKEHMDRQANVIAGFLTITAKNEEAKRRERENEVRKRQRQNEARKRERERDARRREKEKEHTTYSQMAEESHLYTSNVSQLHTGASFRDSVFEGRLDHNLKSNTSQVERSPLPAKVEAPSSTSRITVSNLHPLVTQQDIEELFGVIGDLKSCKMLGRGCAEVVYAQKEDALLALSKYHNRKLDGQPMQCKLNTAPSASLYSPPPARLAPLAPLRPAAKSTPRPLPSSIPAEKNHRPPTQTTQGTRPVVFKVRI